MPLGYWSRSPRASRGVSNLLRARSGAAANDTSARVRRDHVRDGAPGELDLATRFGSLEEPSDALHTNAVRIRESAATDNSIR